MLCCFMTLSSRFVIVYMFSHSAGLQAYQASSSSRVGEVGSRLPISTPMPTHELAICLWTGQVNGISHCRAGFIKWCIAPALAALCVLRPEMYPMLPASDSDALCCTALQRASGVYSLFLGMAGHWSGARWQPSCTVAATRRSTLGRPRFRPASVPLASSGHPAGVRLLAPFKATQIMSTSCCTFDFSLSRKTCFAHWA